MKLSEAEKKMVARLRRQKEYYARRHRSVLLTSFFQIIVGVCAVLMFQHFLQKASDLTTLKLTLAAAIGMTSIAIILVITGAWFIADTLMNWHGKPEVDLLLRLIEESQNEGDHGHGEK